MKKILFLLAIILTFCVSNYENVNAQAKTNIATITVSTSDTLAGLGSWADWYIEAKNGSSDSSRTFTVNDISQVTSRLGVNIGVVDVTAGSSTATIITGNITLTAGQTKIFKVVPETVRGFIFNNTSSRNSISIKPYAMRKIQF